MKLLTRSWKNELVGLAGAAKSDVLVICPFIGVVALDVFGPARKNKATCRLITKLDKVDFWKKVSDSGVLVDLAGQGVAIKSLQDLHAKLYVFDREKVVVTSANLTGGGLERNYEVGLLLEKPTSDAVVKYAEDLWKRLALVTPARLGEINAEVETFRKRRPEKKEEVPDELTDESEKLGEETEIWEIRLKMRISLESAKRDASELNLALGKDSDSLHFNQFENELIQSKGAGISLKSFLWLVGWCNTKGNPKQAGRILARDLAKALFGYVPGKTFDEGGRTWELKNYRYKDKVPFRAQLIKAHEAMIRNPPIG